MHSRHALCGLTISIVPKPMLDAINLFFPLLASATQRLWITNKNFRFDKDYAARFQWNAESWTLYVVSWCLVALKCICGFGFIPFQACVIRIVVIGGVERLCWKRVVCLLIHFKDRVYIMHISSFLPIVLGSAKMQTLISSY